MEEGGGDSLRCVQVKEETGGGEGERWMSVQVEEETEPQGCDQDMRLS